MLFPDPCCGAAVTLPYNLAVWVYYRAHIRAAVRVEWRELNEQEAWQGAGLKQGALLKEQAGEKRSEQGQLKQRVCGASFWLQYTVTPRLWVG